MIDALVVGTVQNTVLVKPGRMLPIHISQADMATVQSLLDANMIIMGEKGYVGIDTVEVSLLFIGVGVKKMIITESTLVKENVIITIIKEAVRGVAADVEKGAEILDVVERVDRIGTDRETDTQKVDTKTDHDREKGLMKNLEMVSVLDQVIDLDQGKDLGTLIVLDQVIDLEIGKDLAIEEKGTGKIKDRVDVAVAVQATGETA